MSISPDGEAALLVVKRGRRTKTLPIGFWVWYGLAQRVDGVIQHLLKQSPEKTRFEDDLALIQISGPALRTEVNSQIGNDLELLGVCTTTTPILTEDGEWIEPIPPSLKPVGREVRYPPVGQHPGETWNTFRWRVPRLDSEQYKEFRQIARAAREGDRRRDTGRSLPAISLHNYAQPDGVGNNEHEMHSKAHTCLKNLESPG